MAEATALNDPTLYYLRTAESTYATGMVLQVKDGRAGYVKTGITAGDNGNIVVSGLARITKTAGIVLLAGDPIYWDHSANAATFRPVNDRDFYVGCCLEDCTSTSTQVDVALNEAVRWNIDIDRDGFLTVPVGTLSFTTPMGLFRRGGAHDFILSSTSEAQKLDMLSIDGFNPTTSNAIIEACFTVPSDGAGSNTDVSIGAASGTHASDFESVAEFVVLHLDGNATAINLASDDGSTDVNPTDTTLTYTEGSAVANRVYLTIDMRNPADVQCYINRVLALDGTTFNVSAAAATWFLVCHVEKASSADTYQLALHHLRCRLGEQ